MRKTLPLFTILLILLVPSINAQYTQFYEQKRSNLFSTLIVPGDGNQYYEERCVDVSKYTSKGCSISLDENGCPIANCLVVLAEMWYPGQPFCSNIRNKCREVVGDPWTRADYYVGDEITSDDQILASITYTNLYSNRCDKCITLGHQTFGGLEKVLNTCDYDQNDLLAAETFSGAQTVTKMDLRYPIKSFCRAHPTIITDNSILTSTTSTNIPQDLIDGNSVTISEDETMTIFYVIENNYNLPTICSSSENLALDTDSGLCVSTLGFTYLCSEGQFDALTGTCVVQPESKTICEKGRYDVQQDLCVWNPPIQVDCGSNNCFYSIDRDICSCVVEEEFYCDEPFTLYMPTETECNELGGTWYLCPQCPTDQICPSTMCSPRCSIGNVCEYEAPEIIQCEDASAKIINGECIIYGDEITTCPTGYTLSNGACYIEGTQIIECPSGYEQVGDKCLKDGEVVEVCPSGTEYNSITEVCEKEISSIEVCEDGSQPQVNSITGEKECIVQVESFISCPEDTIYNMDLKKCVPEILIYDPLTNDFVIYKEVYMGCESDEECGEGFECYVPNGLCYTKYEEISETSKFLKDYWMWIAGGAFVLLLLTRKRK